jgi:hypothetical protein
MIVPLPTKCYPVTFAGRRHMCNQSAHNMPQSQARHTDTIMNNFPATSPTHVDDTCKPRQAGVCFMLQVSASDLRSRMVASGLLPANYSPGEHSRYLAGTPAMTAWPRATSPHPIRRTSPGSNQPTTANARDASTSGSPGSLRTPSQPHSARTGDAGTSGPPKAPSVPGDPNTGAAGTSGDSKTPNQPSSSTTGATGSWDPMRKGLGARNKATSEPPAGSGQAKPAEPPDPKLSDGRRPRVSASPGRGRVSASPGRRAGRNAWSCAACGVTPEKSENGKLLECTGCRTVRYCRKACQVADWPAHKATCKRLRAARP